MVYTWVDGSDPIWREKKERVLKELYGKVNIDTSAASPSRFNSRDELKYSLRSVSMYAPFIRKVYLVTDEQVPPWLDSNNERLIVVSHRDMFSSYIRRPTFSSRVIESQVHHIPGLSEHFLFMNDDIFFAGPVSPFHFFTRNGKAKFFPSATLLPAGEVGPSDTPVTAAGKNVRDLMYRDFGRVIRHMIAHAPYAQTKSLLQELENVYRDEFRRTALHQFRSLEDIKVPSLLYQYYGYYTRRTVPAFLRYAVVNINESGYEQRIKERLLKKRYDTFCLNESSNPVVPVEPDDSFIRGFLENMFPRKSEFEI